MKHISFFKLFGLFAAALVGLMLGRYSPQAPAREYSQSSQAPNPVDANSFNNLPCPTEEQYKALAEKIALQIPEGKAVCDDSHRAKLGKVLLLMDNLRLEAPPEWLPQVQADLKDLLGYVAKNSKFMGLDLTQMGSIAYNQTTSNSIYLGGYFFNAPPLEDISTLIHEARHSVTTAMGHVQCVAGDIPLTVGGCDQEFRTSQQDAGAYAYEVILQAGLSLYGKDLSQGVRQYLMSSALTVLATRFNVVPEALAAKNDILMALDKKGTLYAVDIEKNSFKPVPLKLKNNEKIIRIEFNNRDGGVMLFTDQLRAYSWTFRKGLERFMGHIFKGDFKIVDSARVILPGETGRSRQTVKTPEGVFKYTKLSPKTLDMDIFDMIPPKDLKAYPKFKSYFMGGYGDSAYLTADGKAYLLDVMMNTGKPFKFPQGLQDPKGWRQGTGGVTYSEMFLLNRAGDLKIVKTTFEEIDDNHSKTEYFTEDHPFKTPSRAVKYFQGLKIHAALTENKRIYVRPYGREEAVELSGPETIDFTILQNPVLGKDIVPESH